VIAAVHQASALDESSGTDAEDRTGEMAAPPPVSRHAVQAKTYQYNLMKYNLIKKLIKPGENN